MYTELENYLQRIDSLHTQIYALLTGLSVDALNWRPVQNIESDATNSLAALTAHIAGAERFWIAEVIGRFAPTRDRDAEFATRVDRPEDLTDLLARTGRETCAILSALEAADLDGHREVEGRVVPVRWSILHVIDHTALHLGHMQLTYQLWTGGKSFLTPNWHERLPKTT